MSRLRFIRPVTIDDARLVSHSVAEADHAAWSGATTYALGDRVIKAHAIWESVQAGNINHDPQTDTTGTWWTEISATNRWKMFDRKVGSLTADSGEIGVVLAPGAVTGLALLDIAADVVTVEMTSSDGGAMVYSRVVSVNRRAVDNWYDYYYAPFDDARSTVILTDLPAWNGCRLTVRLEGTGTVTCGTLVAGPVVDVGKVLAGASIGIVDYSRKEVDEFGVGSFVERGYANTIEAEVIVENTDINRVPAQLAAVRATPCVWIASEQIDALVAYGIARDWRVALRYATHSIANFEIEGLT